VLGAVHVVVGTNFRFGAGGSGMWRPSPDLASSGASQSVASTWSDGAR